MRKKGGLNDTEHGIVGGDRQSGLSISGAADLLGFSNNP